MKGTEDTVANFDKLLSAIGESFRDLNRRITDIEQELIHLRELDRFVARLVSQPRTGGEPDPTPLEALLGELVQGYHDHEARLTALSQQRTAQRLTSGGYMVHQDIRNRYLDLIGQQLLDVAATGPHDDQLSEAGVRAFLAHALFQPARVGQNPAYIYAEVRAKGIGVSYERFRSLWQTAAELRQAADDSGHHCVWAFDVRPGSPVDPAWQEPYEGCHPEDPVLFVVAPGYLVDDKPYVKQLVFTEPPGNRETAVQHREGGSSLSPADPPADPPDGLAEAGAGPGQAAEPPPQAPPGWRARRARRAPGRSGWCCRGPADQADAAEDPGCCG